MRKDNDPINRVQDLEEVVRDHINTHRYQSVLLEDSATWNQICSSLDVVGDALSALDSYRSEPFPTDVGLQYIYTYGVLQILFTQQDALRHLSEAFGLNFKENAVLKEIRENRNAAMGHPTKQTRKREKYYNHISRISLSKGGFDLLRFCESRPHEMVRVDIGRAIENQLDVIAHDYQKIVDKLKKTDRMHKEKFEDSPLSDLFHSAMGYCFQKIAAGIHAHSHGDKEFGQSNLKMVNEVYRKFEAALKDRNELNEYLEFDLNEYFHAIDMLEKYFAGEADWMAEKDARIYHSYIYSHHSHFVQVAQEIDAEYQEET